MELTILGLPLGNIEDISLRAIKKLSEANVIICEDTRVFNKLWMKLMSIGQIKERYAGKMVVLNEFNEKDKHIELAERIVEFNDEVVLVSDAGMPLVSDPGYRLVTELIKRGVKIGVVPGPTAAMTALTISGFSADRVLYLGFLPKKQSKKDQAWVSAKLLGDGLTVVLYESPHRVKETLEEALVILGDIPVVIARELTKKHEEVIRGKISEVLASLKVIKGEVVMLFRL